MRQQAIRPDVALAVKNPPEHLVEGLRAVEIDGDAVAVGAFHWSEGLARAARDAGPEIGSEDERHVGVEQRPELAGRV